MNYYSKIPPLNIVVTNDRCILTIHSYKYYIPTGGKALPILIDFEFCLPIEDITLTGNLYKYEEIDNET